MQLQTANFLQKKSLRVKFAVAIAFEPLVDRAKSVDNKNFYCRLFTSDHGRALLHARFAENCRFQNARFTIFGVGKSFEHAERKKAAAACSSKNELSKIASNERRRRRCDCWPTSLVVFLRILPH